jgi:hypothetical protein
MKSRTSLYVLVILIIAALGGIWFVYKLGDQEPTHIFPATINRDCAPWDGSAFTISIPMQGSIMHITIYQSPTIKHPIAFSLQEGTEDIGDAFLLPSVGSPEQLTGKVFFNRVEEENPVEGEFRFRTKSGKRIIGRFQANWGNEIIYCG